MMLKVCGITRLTDALHAAKEGATALGFIFWPRSPRYVSADRAAEIIAELPSAVTKVGVFVNEPIDRMRSIIATARLDIAQLHGDEPPAVGEALGHPVLRSVTLGDADITMSAWPVTVPLLLDAADRDRRGGTGQRVDWSRAAHLARQRRVILAGGLTPDNVSEAVETVNPFGVDVSSGVEEAPGIKDFAKVSRFLQQARDAFERRARL